MTTVETYAKIAETTPRGLIGGAPVVRGEDELKRKYRREPGFPVPILIAPATMWLIVFLFLPLLSIFIFSFWKTTGHGMTPRRSGGAAVRAARRRMRRRATRSGRRRPAMHPT